MHTLAMHTLAKHRTAQAAPTGYQVQLVSSGEVSDVAIFSRDTVRRLRQRISASLGVELRRLQLMFEGRCLDADSKLSTTRQQTAFG